MNLHTLADRLDAQERRLLKIVTIDGESVRTPDDFMIERHDGTVLVPNTSSMCIRVIAIPAGKFLKLAHEGDGDTIATEREVSATGEWYTITRQFDTEHGLEVDTLEVAAVEIRENVAVLIDAPDEPTFEALAAAQAALIKPEPGEAIPIGAIASPMGERAQQMADEEALALIEAYRAKQRAKAAPVAQDAGFAEPAKKPFNSRTFLKEQLAAWRATG